MADLKVKFCGIESPNPFWLASGPPSNTAGQVMRAFDAGWGGAVWKTIGEPIQNTSSRYGAIDLQRRPSNGLQQHRTNQRSPHRSKSKRNRRSKKALPEAPGNRLADGRIEEGSLARYRQTRRRRRLRRPRTQFRLPPRHERTRHGRRRRPSSRLHRNDHSWAKEAARTPVISKLTPNVTDITQIALAAERGGADAVSLINTINSLMGVDLRNFRPAPSSSRKILARRLLRPSSKTNRPALGLQRSQKSKNSQS